MKYEDFLKAKVAAAPAQGQEVPLGSVSPILKPHQRAIVPWLVRGGRRALFASFGLGKTLMQLEAVRLAREAIGGRALIVIPLGVRQEFFRDAAMLGTPVRFIRSLEETEQLDFEGHEPHAVINLTNYETVRDGKLDPRHFTVTSLDEAAVLRGFGGTKTFREFMRLFADDDRRGPAGAGIPFRFVATATPSPNEYIELLAYAAYLGIMDVGEAKTRFFKRNSEKADQLTLHQHKEREFWLWVATWAMFLQRPSDLGPEYSDDGYELPAIDVRWHEISTDHSNAGAERDGQSRLFKNAALGVVDASREKRDSLPGRLSKLMEIRAEEPHETRLIWHDLEAERLALEQAIPDLATVYGSQDIEAREQLILDFSDGKLQELGGKPVMLGSGCNFQRHCARAVFLGIGFKFADFIQAIHRVHRFLQTRPVRVDLIYTEAEREVRRVLETKWRQHDELTARMAAIIREYGLAEGAVAGAMKRSMDVERVEVEGDGWRLINGDSCEEVRAIESDSVGLIVTSIPFGTQYEYSPSYRDLGHTDDDEHFFNHLGYLTPELLRVLKPGRVVAVHVKDRIVPGGLTGLGFQTVSPFSDLTVAHFRRHGFAFLARKTVVTDVVRENNQTYRLGWTEQCKDGSRMGAGLPEYVLLFRKPPTDSSNGYADEPVVKDKAKYSRSRWQVDAHGFMRSNGNRPLAPEDLRGLPHAAIFRLFRDYSLSSIYDFEAHVALGEALEEKAMLPVTFMLLQPQSWHPDVWTDVTRMRTLNGAQAMKGREAHLCPLQFDIVERLVTQFSQPGELVLDPFAGLGTVPYCALKLGRRSLGIELSARYFADAVGYCEAASREARTPTLFDLIGDASA